MTQYFPIPAFLSALRAFQISCPSHMRRKKHRFPCRHIFMMAFPALIPSCDSLDFQTYRNGYEEKNQAGDEYHPEG